MPPEIPRDLLKNTKSESDIIYNIGGGRLERYGYVRVSAIDQNEARTGGCKMSGSI